MTPTPDQLQALVRLWRLANGHSGQCRHVAAFLLGLYNGPRFPFDLTRTRCVDRAIFADMLKVLIMDSSPQCEVHIHLMEQLPGERIDFERMADDWGIPSAPRVAA